MKANRIERTTDLIVIGSALRTSNETAAQEIPGHWQRFLKESIASRLPGRKDDPAIYAVYCDYESDHRGPYTLVLGVAADMQTEVPPSMRRVCVPRGAYARFDVHGDANSVLWQTWAFVSGEWDGRRERRFVTDFERYEPDAMKDGTVRADLVVGLS